MVRRASTKDATAQRAQSDISAMRREALVPITAIALDPWQALAERAIEPNGYYLPEWELAINASAQGRSDTQALSAWHDGRLIGLLPVTSLWRACKIPMPAAQLLKSSLFSINA